MSEVSLQTDLQGFRARLRGLPLASVFSLTSCTDNVEIIALAGFDAVILDMEHGPATLETVRLQVLAAQARGIHPIVRVRANDPSLISAALDVGADGVLVPQIGSAEEARRAVSAARFAPEGARGANPYVRAAGFHGDALWYRRANAQTAVLVMIEGTSGAAAAEDIMKVPGLDGVFLGPVDFSHAMGVPGQIDHPSVVGKFEQIIRLGAALGVCTAVFAPTAEGGQTWLDRGARMVAIGCDTSHIFQALQAILQSVRAKLPASGAQSNKPKGLT
jgi:4-hydroxy-2-oxoheptanedioate aldolase